MYLCYVICGVLIALSSYVFHIKSSGHAAGVVGPVMILSLRVSPWYLFGLLLMIPVGISSVKLGRHTPKEILLGSCYPVNIPCFIHSPCRDWARQGSRLPAGHVIAR